MTLSIIKKIVILKDVATFFFLNFFSTVTTENNTAGDSFMVNYIIDDSGYTEQSYDRFNTCSHCPGTPKQPSHGKLQHPKTSHVILQHLAEAGRLLPSHQPCPQKGRLRGTTPASHRGGYPKPGVLSQRNTTAREQKRAQRCLRQASAASTPQAPHIYTPSTLHIFIQKPHNPLVNTPPSTPHAQTPNNLQTPP